MSAEPKALHEEDVLPSRRILVTIAVAVLVTLAGVGVAASILRLDRRGGPPPDAVGRAPVEITRVEQSLIESTRRGLDLRRAQKDALDHYQWVDRDAGVVQIPIDRAMDLTAERAR